MPRPYIDNIIGQSTDMISEDIAEKLSIEIADAIAKELTFTLGKN